ncbi:hypothetical protein CWR43_27995 [Rhizobium sullae]|uniref:Uncharacterized protein n=2 Tax=Rhizobium sullae TaxID=50338 RepID=A0A2N0D3G7_RHISU|nr:hypothetical protein CWR43_27995 [Rhizobium sullae]
MTQYGRRHDHCGLWSWGNKPLVDADTHAARKEAHRVFDQLWRGGYLGRGEAYQALSWATGWPETDCHMMHMTKDKARLVPTAVRKIWAVIDGQYTDGATNAT